MLLVTYKELVGIWRDMRNDVFRSALFQASSVDEPILLNKYNRRSVYA